MTIEIRQLVIRSVVSGTGEPSSADKDSETADCCAQPASSDKDQVIVARCVRAVLRQLERMKER